MLILAIGAALTPPQSQLLGQRGHRLLEVFSSREALREAAATSPDVVMLDTQLPDGTDGVSLARQLPTRPLLFLTDHTDEATFERVRQVRPLALLSRTVDPMLLARTLELAALQRPSADAPEVPGAGDFFFVRDRQRLLRLQMTEIVRLEADGQYFHVYTAQRKHTVRGSLRRAEQHLPAGQFVRVHRRWVVRLSAIEVLDAEARVLFVAGQPVPLGRIFREQLLEQLPLIVHR